MLLTSCTFFLFQNFRRLRQNILVGKVNQYLGVLVHDLQRVVGGLELHVLLLLGQLQRPADGYYHAADIDESEAHPGLNLSLVRELPGKIPSVVMLATRISVHCPNHCY